MSDFQRADEAASVAHDFIWGKNGVTKKQASDSIWVIHEVLRPLIPLSAHLDYEEIVAAIREGGEAND